MTGDSALAEILADMERMKHTFDLDRNNLGRDLCKAATDGVQANIAGQHSAEGEGWEYLSEKYAEWKSYQFPGNPMAVLHQIMANPHEIAGEVAVTSDTATVTEGITEQGKAEYSWFSEGNSHQPGRPSWGFTPDSLKEIGDILDKRFHS